MAHLVLPMGNVMLVLGLQWVPVIGSKPLLQARRLARRQKATHFVTGGDPVMVVGAGRLNHRRAGQQHSAAQAVARLYPQGTVAMLMPVPSHGYWLVAVHDGVVVARADKLFADLASANVVLDELRQAYPQLSVLGEGQDASVPGLPDIGAAVCPGTLLHRCRSWPRRALHGAVLAACIIAPLSVMHGRTSARATPASSLTLTAAQVRSAWEHATLASLSGRAVHGVRGSQELFDHLHALSVRPGGWGLRRVQCLWASLQWRCEADYERSTASASSATLLDAIPQGRQTAFPSVDAAKVAWSFPVAHLALTGVSLPDREDTERRFLSALQHLKPAFADLRLAPAQPLPVQAPRHPDGSPTSRPSAVTQHFTRALALRGPLRSVSLLMPHTRSVAWNKVVLSVRDDRMPGLLNSRLDVSLEGVLHEVEEPQSPAPSPR